MLKYTFLLTLLLITGFQCKSTAEKTEQPLSADIIVGAEQPERYLDLLIGKKVALVVNQTSTVKNKHLVDFLLLEGVLVNKVFAPEHGIRGQADAGATINNEIDEKTGLPIISLYGANKKPSKEALADVDIVIFDLQDVGARFYTYISTLHYVMEACAESGKKLIVLDRPNPNGDYIDGPILEKEFSSFVGMHPIPIVHGLTVGELAQMINGEKWLANKLSCDLTVIPVKNYTHQTAYSLPIKPSPNLPNDQAIRLYPSLCLFEGTDVSVGRGTDFPFQVYGFPDKAYGQFTFTPKAKTGATQPPHKDKLCYGEDLRKAPIKGQFSLSYLLKAYEASGRSEKFFNAFFDKLAGTDELKAQIIAGLSEEEIRFSWSEPLAAYQSMRKKYLIYP
ncbi:exo-beta-N-acetylmuramidase NamZ family protein [Penaeicola halotolerans]|uniref:exo-beta-N-acetylmuramidase NamZ family protein n=1 Tax=Penaeicola halotolerans TaxID=2793196 RepID=UPI001CF90A66|nr:DUF1343 domain-containing protein [Penaeicola halotolerans]